MSDECEYPSNLSDPNDVEYLLGWEDSARLWLTDAGREWPGGRRNLDLMCAKLIALGLADASDKVGALTIAYQALCEEGALIEPEEEEDDE